MPSETTNTLVTIANTDPSIIAVAKNTLAREKGVLIVSEAMSFETILYQLSDLPTDLLVFPLTLPGSPYNSGFAGIKTIRREYPKLRMITWVDGCSHASISTAISIGIEGISTVAAIPTELRRAVSSVSRGRHYVSPQLQGTSEDQVKDGPLSASEVEVLDLTHAGLGVAEIAQLRHTSNSTAAKQREAALMKLALDGPVSWSSDATERCKLLSEEEAEVIELVRLGFTAAEIAKICGRSASIISKEKHSALLKLTVAKITVPRKERP